MVMAEPVRRGPIRVGFYDIIRTIGKGNFAVVKLARHRITKTEVAIKIIEKTRLDQSNLNKIYREIQILKLLRHQHIIKLYQVMETKTMIYLVCEYASHGEVFDYITQEEKLPEDQARKMFYQVLTAIEYCHKNNVVHRDLKAENLLLDSNNNVKLADFGFGNFFQSGQNLNTWCGSPPYAAPEVFEGKLYEGPQLDIWSLGIVLYVLVCGTFPFDGSNLATLKDRVLAGRFRIPYWMSEDCENLIRRMLVVNPKKRLTIAQIKKHKWMQVFATKPDVVIRKSDSPVRRIGTAQLPEFSEQILKMIQGLGIDRQKTVESLRNSAYDHLYAIYHLLADMLKHHRTSVPVEFKFSYDGGRRRSSNIADQSIANYTTSNPITVPLENVRLPHANRFFTPAQIPSTMTVDHSMTSPPDDVTYNDVTYTFVEDLNNEPPIVHRSLALGPLQVPHIPQPPVSPNAVSKARFMAQASRAPLPHQPWSFNAGVGFRAVYQRPPNAHMAVRHRDSGDVIPSVTSIDEGVELASTPPSDFEMFKKSNQQRRHTLGLPDMTSFAPLIKIGSQGCDQVSVSGASQADSLLSSINASSGYDQDSLSSSLEITCNVNHVHSYNASCDVTPRVVLSPCADETVPQSPDPRTAYMDNQRQLLDVSPTGFREGRRASDGLLLLGDNRIGEHLKRLTRANGFPNHINQEENEDGCFEYTETEGEVQQNSFQSLNAASKPSELGAMTSHSSQHVMQMPRSDVINFQPYAPSNRRRSLQVSHYIAEGRCGSYSKDLATPFVQQPAANQMRVFHQGSRSCDKPDADNLYQWSSWKTVNETEKQQQSAYVNSNQRRDTIPLLTRAPVVAAFAVASDESMTRSSTVEQAKRQPSLPSPASPGHQLVGQPSLVQQLQQRRLSRRLKVAHHNMQPVPSYPLPLPELEQLKIDPDVSFGCPVYHNEGVVTSSTEELAGRLLTQNGMSYVGSDIYRGDSPELQHQFPADPNETFQHNVVLDQHSPSAFAHDIRVPLAPWSDRSEPVSFHSKTVMEYSYS